MYAARTPCRPPAPIIAEAAAPAPTGYAHPLSGAARRLRRILPYRPPAAGSRRRKEGGGETAGRIREKIVIFAETEHRRAEKKIPPPRSFDDIWHQIQSERK